MQDCSLLCKRSSVVFTNIHSRPLAGFGVYQRPSNGLSYEETIAMYNQIQEENHTQSGIVASFINNFIP